MHPDCILIAFWLIEEHLHLAFLDSIVPRMQALTTAPSPSHRYKAFLDKLTPVEYFEEQERLRQQRRVLRKQAKLAVRQEEVNIQFELDR